MNHICDFFMNLGLVVQEKMSFKDISYLQLTFLSFSTVSARNRKFTICPFLYYCSIASRKEHSFSVLNVFMTVSSS